VADTPQYLTLKDSRDDRGRLEIRIRRGFLALIGAVLLAGLLNVFGQEPVSSALRSPAAELAVDAPTSVRGGLLYQARFTIRARADVKSATLVLDRGWTEQTQINTIEPSPVGEASRHGKLTLDFGHVATGDVLVAYLQFQVNPVNVGRRAQGVALYDGKTLLGRVDRTLTVFP
jgi:hypothetical protein